MAPDDRERTFDKALARHLRPPAPGGADASHPDAELLAAYHERLLAPEQMISSKEHIAGCSRCQQILAQLEATDDLLVEVNQEEHQAQNVLTMPEPDLAQVSAEAPTPAAPRITAATRVSRLRKATRGANWRWLAPTGALAAGLLLWVSFHETKPPQFQLAKNQQPPAPSSAPATIPQPAAAGKKESPLREPPGSSPAARGGARTESDAFAQNDQAQNKRTQDERAALDQKTVAPMQIDKVTASRHDSSPKLSAALADRDTNRPNLTADISAEEKQRKKQAPASVPGTPPPAELKGSVSNMVVIAPPPSKPEASAKAKAVTSATGRQAPQDQQTAGVAAAQPAPQQPQQIPGDVTTLSAVEDSATRVAETRRMHLATLIPAPGGTVVWRAGQAGVIQRSAGAGSAWTVQVSGVVADLTAGSAPSDKICWIVGRAGTILRTTDGGAHWQKIPPPVVDDLAAVFAIDAQQATVSLASSHKTYKTSDAGSTWTLLPSP